MPASASTSEPAALRALIFDVDGTLVDTLDAMHRALNDTLARAGVPLWPREAVRRRMSLGVTGLVALALPDHGDQAVHAARLRRRYRCEVLDTALAFPGADAVLPALRGAGLRLAVCSNADGEVLEALFERLGWQQHFEHIVHADNARALKPSGAPALQALQALGLAAGEAALVGDSELDASCALAAGCRFVWFRPGYGGPQTGADAWGQVDSLTELLDRLTA